MTRPIRVVHVIARMNVGGPAVLIASTIRGLDRDEFSVRLISGYCNVDEADYLDTQAPDVPVERLAGFGRSVRPWSDLTSAAALGRRLRELRPDVIHTHTAKAGVVGRVAARLARVDAALVHTYHGHLLNGYFSPRKTKAILTLERSLAARTDRLVAVGPQVRDDLLAAGVGRAEQYEVIVPGVETPVLPDPFEARRSLGLDPTRPVVAMIGRLTGIKRPDRFAAAAQIVSDARPDVQFIVAGSGDCEASLREAVAHLPVAVLGWRSDIGSLLAASDAVVLTSDNEGTPLSLIQAGLAGLPVVATDVGSVRDVVVDGQTGVLCPPDAGAVATALLGVLSDPEGARSMGSAAREFTSESFGMGQMIAAHAQLYRSVLHDR